MNNELLFQILSLFPVVAATAVVIERVVEFGKKINIVPEGKAAYVQVALNAAVYGLMLVAGQLGYATQVNTGIAWVNTHINEVTAALGFAVLVSTSSGVTKLAHEAIKRVYMWWTNLGSLG